MMMNDNKGKFVCSCNHATLALIFPFLGKQNKATKCYVYPPNVGMLSCEENLHSWLKHCTALRKRLQHGFFFFIRYSLWVSLEYIKEDDLRTMKWHKQNVVHFDFEMYFWYASIL